MTTLDTTRTAINSGGACVMDTAQAVGMFVVGGGALIAIITPIIKLNSSIVSLTVKIDNLVNDLTRNEKRITEHGKEIEVLEAKVQNHDLRISVLEKSQ